MVESAEAAHEVRAADVQCCVRRLLETAGHAGWDIFGGMKFVICTLPLIIREIADLSYF